MVAALAMVLLLVPIWYGFGLLAEAGSTLDETGRQIALALGSVVLLVTALTLAPLGFFLWRGGRVPFAMGGSLVAILLLYWAVTVR